VIETAKSSLRWGQRTLATKIARSARQFPFRSKNGVASAVPSGFLPRYQAAALSGQHNFPLNG